MKIGVLFGTYNPIHNGHLLISTALVNGGYFDKVIYSVANKKIKNNEQVPSMSQRATMIYRAFGKVNLEVEDDIEVNDTISISFVEKRGKSWRVYDCFEQLKKENPNNEYCLIIGGDQMNLFHTWYKFEDLIDEYNIHCMMRSSQVNNDELLNKLKKHDIDINKITFVNEFPQIELSSTKIRQLVKEDKNIEFYVPENVREYILMKELYK